MAVAALEAMDELDLFGIRGGPTSVIHVMSDEVQKCRAVLQNMLPRESLSKETDASLLTVIGYPAFAVDDPELIDTTRDVIVSKLGGGYGCKRFLRDGYKNPREDSSRLHYETWELRLFDNIECQWPMFFCNLAINGYFMGDDEMADKYSRAVETLLIDTSAGLRQMPELYSVPAELAQAEQEKPGSQEFVPSGRLPLMWAQSLYIITQLLKHQYISLGELDPINRRLSSQSKPEVVVQVVIMAKDERIKDLLTQHGYAVQTLKEITSIEVRPARVLSHLYAYLGRNEKLGLHGRRNREVGILTTSKLYKIQNRIFAFTPQRFDFSRNYMDCDISLMMTTLEYGLNYLSSCWKTSGRPTISLVMGDNMLENGQLPPAMQSALKKLKGGYINGTRVEMGNYEQFLRTTSITDLSFLVCTEDGNPYRLQPELEKYLTQRMGKPASSVFALLGKDKMSSHLSHRRKLSIRSSIRRSRSRVDESHIVEPVVSRRTSRQLSGDILSPREKDLDVSSDDEELTFDHFSSSEEKQKFLNNSRYSAYDVEQLVSMMAEAPSIEEQADILHYLILCHGTRHKFHISQMNRDVDIRELLTTLYETALMKRSWHIVRQAAGFLGKQIDDLSKAATDLLVRQKEVTVGLPPTQEVIISMTSLKSSDLRKLIHISSGGDESISILTQELLVYLSMFIQTEPELFRGMLRVRIGLIIQVMTSEMTRCLKVKDEDASDDLMSLSPFEMRNLLHHIMSGSEFCIQHKQHSGYNIVSDNSRVTKTLAVVPGETDDEDDSDDGFHEGIWRRRRQLDGALNRVPRGFYSKVWKILENCRGISILGRTLDTHLTEGMTSGEMKFALEVESVLNAVPEPEFRQLLVEAIMIISEAVERKILPLLNLVIVVEDIVRRANDIFLADQTDCEESGPCCSEKAKDSGCGSAGICRNFYDSAPSGNYGTMCYLIRAACIFLDKLPDAGYIECMPS